MRLLLYARFAFWLAIAAFWIVACEPFRLLRLYRPWLWCDDRCGVASGHCNDILTQLERH